MTRVVKLVYLRRSSKMVFFGQFAAENRNDAVSNPKIAVQDRDFGVQSSNFAVFDSSGGVLNSVIGVQNWLLEALNAAVAEIAALSVFVPVNLRGRDAIEAGTQQALMGNDAVKRGRCLPFNRVTSDRRNALPKRKPTSIGYRFRRS